MNDLDERFGSGESDAELVDALRSLHPLAPQVDWEAIHVARSGSEEHAIEASAGVGHRSHFGSSLMIWWSGVACGAVVAGLVMQWFVVHDLRSKVRRYEQVRTEGLSIVESGSGAISSEVDNEKEPHGGLSTVRYAPLLTVRSYRVGAFLTGLERIDPIESASIGSGEDGNESLGFRSKVADDADEVPPVVGRFELLEQLLSDVR